MKLLKRYGVWVSILVLLLIGAPKAKAEQTTITTAVFITIRELPEEIASENPNTSECLHSQIERNPESMPEINVDKIQSDVGEVTRYTICEKL